MQKLLESNLRDCSLEKLFPHTGGHTCRFHKSIMKRSYPFSLSKIQVTLASSLMRVPRQLSQGGLTKEGFCY